MRMRLKQFLALGLVALAACSPAAVESKQAQPVAGTAQTHPISGLRIIPLTAGVHAFRVELAASPEEQEKGLMFRKEMGANEGMLFPMNPPRQAHFWMRNTVMPLDIIFIGADRRVLNVVQAKPYDETPLPSAGLAAAVLELNVGRAAELGIGPGTTVKW